MGALVVNLVEGGELNLWADEEWPRHCQVPEPHQVLELRGSGHGVGSRPAVVDVVLEVGITAWQRVREVHHGKQTHVRICLSLCLRLTEH